MMKRIQKSIPAGLDVTDWAKLAAFIDGEGCICVQYHNRRGAARRSYQLRLQITNTSPRLMRWLQRFEVGNIVARPQRTPWKMRYDWTVNGRAACDILEQCAPHFVIKMDQAILAMSFQTSRKHWGKAGTPEAAHKAWTFIHRRLGELKADPTVPWEELIQ